MITSSPATISHLAKSMARYLIAMLLIVWFSAPALACLPPDDPFFVTCQAETTWSRLFRVVFGPQTKPRRIAVIMSISKYDQLTDHPKVLDAARADSEMLIKTLMSLKYDEIIKISDEYFTEQHLERIFERYLPAMLIEQKTSQLLITFSGHGNEFENEGYILLPKGTRLNINTFADTWNGWLRMSKLKDILYSSIKYAHQSLFLLNSCKSGHFVRKADYGPDRLSGPTAQVITAGGPRDLVSARGDIGDHGGSIFFEIVNAAMANTPLRTPLGPIAPPGGDGILTFPTLFSFLHDTTLKVTNRAIAPIPGIFMIKARPPEIEGGFFLITDEERAKKYLATQYPDNYRSLFGAGDADRPSAVGPDYSALPERALDALAFGYDIEPKLGITSSGDWTAFKLKRANDFCFMETTGVEALNAYTRSRGQRTGFQRDIQPLGKGKDSKIRIVYDSKSKLAFFIYLTKADLSVEYGKIVIGSHVVGVVQTHTGNPSVDDPAIYSPKGTFIFGRTDSVIWGFKSGDYVVVEGYTANYQSEHTARVIALSPRAKGYLFKQIRDMLPMGRFLSGLIGGGDEDPKQILSILKREIKLFGKPLVESSDVAVKKKAGFESLSNDDVYAVGQLDDDDLIPLVEEVSKRDMRFKDELSLWGFSDVYDAMMQACSQENKAPKVNQLKKKAQR